LKIAHRLTARSDVETFQVQTQKCHLTQNVSQMICYDVKRIKNVFLCHVFFDAITLAAEVGLFSFIAQSAYFGAIWRRQYATYRDSFFTISDLLIGIWKSQFPAIGLPRENCRVCATASKNKYECTTDPEGCAQQL